MIPIVTPTEMAAIDATAPESVEVLVGRAGAAVAIAARQMMGGTYGRRVLVAAGTGNNGADGRVAADVLTRWGARCRVATPSEALDLVLADTPTPAAATWDLVIDAAYGTGLRGAWGAVRPPAAAVLAVDLPSGVDAVTGFDHGCWPAAATVTFGALKPGLLLHPGAALAGDVQLAPIGLDTGTATSWLVTDADARAVLPVAEPTAHKWRRAVRVIAGSPQMRGAGHLVCAAAQQAGGGMVVISSPGLRAAEVARPAEAVARDLPAGDWSGPALSGIERFGAAVIGPGIGADPSASSQMARFIAECPVPLVIDADALSALADCPECLSVRTAPTVLTPHDGEFAKLTGKPPAADRFETVRQAASGLGAVVLLKGPTTLVAAPQSTQAASTPARSAGVLAVTSGTPRLATAGSGDVLAGVLAAVLAGGATSPDLVPARSAAAAHWHGRTATFGDDSSAFAQSPLTAMRQVERLGQVRAELAAAAAAKVT
ncbi:NAD(P)H-hydrate dehydratase [Candidatus Poriferisodalis sp.]|uniref:NAD(P)H-hydrate dehydratase n=1 Tax=Candidatus Poriferisodalis sp. TaxID=3101277 RepID=UPI003B013267